MKTTFTKLKRWVADFDRDQRGLQAIQTILIIVILAMILLLVVSQWDSISIWVANVFNKVTGGGMNDASQVEKF